MKWGGGTLNKKIELSIIVPVYNVEKYIGECLDSILKIKNINYEVLVINDGSPDNSQKIIDEYCKKDSRIKSFIKENGGLSSARNYGLERAKGEYIWFIDSDDFINSDEFEKFYKKLDKNLDILIGDYFSLTKKELRKGIGNYENDVVFLGKEFLKKNGDSFLKRSYVWTNLYKNNFLKENNLYFEKGIVIEDQLFTIQCFLKAKKIKFVDSCIYYYRIREGSITTSPDRELFAKSSYKICEELLKLEKEINNLCCVKKLIFSRYIDYLNYYPKRDLKLEKRLWKIKEKFLFKIKLRFKLWKRTYLYRKYSIKK